MPWTASPAITDLSAVRFFNDGVGRLADLSFSQGFDDIAYWLNLIAYCLGLALFL